MKKKKVVIVNDCSKFHHFGCELVMDGYYEAVERTKMLRIIGTIPCGALAGDLEKKIAAPENKILHKADLVIVNGEGSLHDDAHPNLIKLAKHFPCVLMNTVFENNLRVDGLRDFLGVFVREPLSQLQVTDHGVHADIVPDVMLMAPLIDEMRIKQHAWGRQIDGPILRIDSELYKGVGWGPIEPAKNFLYRITQAGAVVCGRFHGILSCVALRVPFVAFRSNTHKNRGLMIDLGMEEYYRDDPEEALAVLKNEFPERFPLIPQFYIGRAREKIMDLFEWIYRAAP